MAGGNHLVVDGFFLGAQVARQAFFRAARQVSRVVHPGSDRLLVGPASRSVWPEPCRRGPMAILAGDAFGQLECPGPRLGRYIERVAGQTLRGLFGFSYAQDAPHALTDQARERLVGLGVLILHHPNAVFILENAAIGARLDAAMATGRTAGAGPGVLARFSGSSGGGRHRQRGRNNRAPQNSAPQRPALPPRPDSHSFAWMQRAPGGAS